MRRLSQNVFLLPVDEKKMQLPILPESCIYFSNQSFLQYQCAYHGTPRTCQFGMFGIVPTTTYYQYSTRANILLSSKFYDDLGRLSTNYRHISTDTVSYTYNVRNWTNTIKSGPFKEELFYNTSNFSCQYKCLLQWKYSCFHMDL